MTTNETTTESTTENVDLKRYIREFAIDTEISVSNLREKSLTMSAIRAKWLSYFMKERENYKRITNLKSELTQKLLQQQSNNVSLLKLKSEDHLAKSDPRIQKLTLLMKKTQENIDYLERAMSILNDMVWQIKNTIGILQLENS